MSARNAPRSAWRGHRQLEAIGNQVRVVRGLSDGRPELAGLYTSLGEPLREQGKEV